MWMFGHGWGMGGLGVIVLVLLVVALVALVVRAQAGPGAAGPGQAEETPLEILRRRLARGEIDAAEFEAKRRLLG